MRYSKQTNVLLWAVNLAVCVGLGLAGKSLYTLFVGSHSESDVGLMKAVVRDAPEANSVPIVSNVDAILKSRLFGQSKGLEALAREALEKQAKAVPPDVPKIDIPLKLIGTIAGNGAISMAIIEETKQGRQDVYTKGDVLLNAKIEDIQQNQVILLLAGGVRYVLDASSPDKSGHQQVARAAATPVVEAPIRPDEVVREMSSSEVLINSQARNVAKHRLSRVMDTVSLRAVSEKGKMPGVRITGLPDSLLGRMIGLSNGDVIHKINGHPVANARKASQVLKKARLLGNAKVQFSRGAKEQTLMLHTGVW